MSQIIRLLVTLTIILCLTSCHTVTKVVQSNSKTVTVQYNSAITDYSKAAALADTEAKKYGKVPVARTNVDKRMESAFGAVNVLIFDLVEE